jgi:hypothetical protein
LQDDSGHVFKPPGSDCGELLASLEGKLGFTTRPLHVRLNLIVNKIPAHSLMSIALGVALRFLGILDVVVARKNINEVVQAHSEYGTT